MGRHFNSIESLENRRLFAAYALDVDERVSFITGTATLGGVPLSGSESALTATLDGTIDVSITKRGLRFTSDGGVTATNANGEAISFTVPGGSGITIDLSDPEIGFGTAGRLRLRENGKFSVGRITTEFTEGSIGATGGASADLSNTTFTLDPAIGRVKVTDTSAKVTLPFAFTVTASINTGGGSQSFVGDFSGLIEARTTFASGAAIAATKSEPAEKKDSVADGVLG